MARRRSPEVRGVTALAIAFWDGIDVFVASVVTPYGVLNRRADVFVTRAGDCLDCAGVLAASWSPDFMMDNKKAMPGGAWLEAEGTGLEPATGKPAPDFESGR